MVAGCGMIFLGVEFPWIASTRFSNETMLAIGLHAYGAFFILLGVFGIWESCHQKRGCQILFLVISICASCSFLGYGGYVTSQLGNPIFGN